MDLKKLEYLEAVYRLRNFTKAAEELYVSQPSISSSIQNLEEELNVTLINRNTRPLAFTEAGEKFMVFVNRILKDVKDAEDTMKQYCKQAQETLRIAIYSSPTSQIIPKIYLNFQRLYPQYTLSITENTLTAMMEEILSEKIDMAYTLIPEDYDTTAFKAVPMDCCELQVLLSKHHPFAKQSSISLEQLSSESIFSYPVGSLIRKKLDQELVRQHVDLKQLVPHRVDFALPIVEQNQGISFILYDKFYSIPSSLNTVTRPLKTPVFFRCGLLYKKDTKMTPAMRAMKNCLEQIHA